MGEIVAFVIDGMMLVVSDYFMVQTLFFNTTESAE
jgi:hypothetical protein